MKQLPEDLKEKIPSSVTNLFSLVHYTLNETLRIPNPSNYETNMETDLALKLKPRRMEQENMAIARLGGKVCIDNGKYVLVTTKESIDPSKMSNPAHWVSPNPNLALKALHERGINGSISQDRSFLEIHEPKKALIEFHSTETVVSTDEETFANLILGTLCSVLDGI